MPYKGVLFIGLMIDEDKSRVLEYNCRFGDPEAQVILPLLTEDLAEILQLAAKGQLDQIQLHQPNQSAVCVVLASGGYPGAYAKGKTISGADSAQEKGIVLFHSGTAKNGNGNLVTNGGRVLSVVAVSENFQTSRKMAYKAADNIKFEGVYFRKDIGEKALKYL